MALPGDPREPAAARATVAGTSNKVAGASSGAMAASAGGGAATLTVASDEPNEATSAAASSEGNGALAPSLATELTVLREAQRAMREGRPASALDILDRNAPLFRGSPLDAERRATRLLALCKASPGEEAKRAATRFLAESPGSPLAASVRQACALGREEP
ncbi:MAG: hypothetical protein MUF34_38175 [Polyangiaceae bacterium]|nr:hypothetical protein [Polyangiaceae bacterium]